MSNYKVLKLTINRIIIDKVQKNKRKMVNKVNLFK